MTFPFYDGPRWSPDLLLDKIHHYWSISDLDHQKLEKETMIRMRERITTFYIVSSFEKSDNKIPSPKIMNFWSSSTHTLSKWEGEPVNEEYPFSQNADGCALGAVNGHSTPRTNSRLDGEFQFLTARWSFLSSLNPQPLFTSSCGSGNQCQLSYHTSKKVMLFKGKEHFGKNPTAGPCHSTYTFVHWRHKLAYSGINQAAQRLALKVLVCAQRSEWWLVTSSETGGARQPCIFCAPIPVAFHPSPTHWPLHGGPDEWWPRTTRRLVVPRRSSIQPYPNSRWCCWGRFDWYINSLFGLMN